MEKAETLGRSRNADVLLPSRPDLYFQRLVDNLPGGAYTCDTDGLITYYNQEAVKIWGREPKLNDPVDRFCGSFKLFASDGTPLDHAECWMALALRDEKGYNREEILVERPDGQRLMVLAHANPIHDETGQLIGAINMLVDISEKWHAEAAQRVSEDRLASKVADLERLHALSTRLLEQDDVEAALHEVMAASADLLHADKASVQVYDEQGDLLKLVGALGLDEEFADKFQIVERGGFTTCAAALGRRKQVLVEDLSANSDFAEFRRAAAPYGVRSALSTPLYGGDSQLLGVFTMYWDDPHSPAEDELKLLDLYVQQAARQVERTRSGEALQESEERFRGLFESVPVAVYVCDRSAVIQHYNRRAAQFWGREPKRGDPNERYCGSVKLYLPDGTLLPHWQSPMVDVLRDGVHVQNVEVSIERPDGSRLPVIVNFAPLKDARGEVIGAITSFEDISELKLAEDRLREHADMLATINRVTATLSAELELERLVQAVTDAGTELSKAEFGAFFYNVLNEQGEHYTLYTLSGVSHEAFSNFPMPRNTEVFGPTFRGEGVVRSHDITEDPLYGKQAPYYGMPEGHLPVKSYLAVPVTSRSGTVLGGLFFGHSEKGIFTEQAEELVTALASHAAIAIDNAQLYEEARRLNETLEEKVEQRTADLKALNDELESFNYSVAHDLRGSLRGIDGFSQVILDECGETLSENHRHYLARIGRAAGHMGQLIDGLLELSRLTRFPLTQLEVDLSELAHAVFAQLSEHEPNRNLTITIQSDLKAIGDSGLLRVALQNLLGNSWKFTRDQTEARIEVGRIEKNGECVFFVRDNGAGFDMKYIDKLFRPFQRLHSPGEYEGTGIGLATVKRVIHNHCGCIWAESEPGKGTTFYFTIGPSAQILVKSQGGQSL